MSVEKIVYAVLQSLADTGISKRTIDGNYACFYRALKKENGEMELNDGLIASYLCGRYGKNLLAIPNCQLTRHEQTGKQAFRVLLDYLETNTLPARFCTMRTPRKNDLEMLEMYIHSCAEAGNALKTLQRKRESINRFISANDLHAITPSIIQMYLGSFSGKSAYYLKKERWTRYGVSLPIVDSMGLSGKTLPK